MKEVKKDFFISNVFKKHLGFTLAEILITLAIIGIVAALTIPALIQDHRKREAVAKLKKNLAVFNQVFSEAVKENGPMEIWTENSAGSGEAAVDFLANIKPYLKMDKDCGTDVGCFPDLNYVELNGNTTISNFNTSTAIAKARLTDETLFYISITQPKCNDSPGTSPTLINSSCGTLGLDINGYKGPNRRGIDAFVFWITRRGIIPVGTDVDNTTFADGCKNMATASGISCAAWVVYNDNTDYLYCSNLDWGVKRECDKD